MKVNNNLTPIFNGSVLVNETALHDQAVMNVLKSASLNNFEFRPISGDSFNISDRDWAMIKTFNLSKLSLNCIQELGYNYTENDDTISVRLPDLDYDFGHSIIDPDKQLCYQYGINYNHLVSID